jgi:CheY-like chemotaxis protein
LLEKWGHRVTVVNNGREAVEQSAARPFDLILMDVQMPEMDGLEATAMIRQREQPWHLHTPIIAMTAHALKGDRERCLETGMDGYVAKPIRPKELHAVIEQVCAAAPRAAEPAPAPAAAPAAAQVCNWSAALEAVQGDCELLKIVAGAFLEESPGLLRDLQQAIMSGNARDVQRTAHKLRGAVRTFGGNAALDQAGHLEALGEQGTLSGAEASFAVLQREVETLIQELTAFVRSDDASQHSDSAS